MKYLNTSRKTCSICEKFAIEVEAVERRKKKKGMYNSKFMETILETIGWLTEHFDGSKEVRSYTNLKKILQAQTELLKKNYNFEEDEEAY